MRILLRAAISFLIATIVGLTSQLPSVQRFEHQIADLWFRVRGPEPAPGDVIVVAIDESSYRDLDVPFDKPWPRSLHARLLDKLKELGAARVIFDILFVDESSQPAGDDALTRSLKGLPTTIGVESTIQYVAGPGGGYFLDELVRPYAPFRAVSQEALVSVIDSEGAIRHFPKPRSDQEARFPFLSEAAAGLRPEDGKPRPGPRDFINYYGPAKTVPIISYWEFLHDELPFRAETIKDKVIIVGLLLRSETGAAQKDAYTPPFGGAPIFGAEVHATMALNLIHDSWIRRSSAWIEMISCALLALIFSFLALSVSPLVLCVSGAAIVFLWAFFGYLLWTNCYFLCGGFVIVGVIPGLIFLSALYYYFIARRSEAHIRSAFELYVSPEMVPTLGDYGNSLKLGGEKLWVTALFTDIEEFTAISEDMPAEKTSEMLNTYFSEVMEVILVNHGALLKFIGDAVFALFGAPIKTTNHAELALRTALDIQREVDKFNNSKRFPQLKTRVGVHTGPMLVGNLGSRRRFDYTAIGDAVNLASRVEGLNKYFGTKLLFTEATRRDANTKIPIIEIATVRVKGRKESVRLYSIFEPELVNDTIVAWKEALDYFSRRQFDISRERFEKVRVEEPRLAIAAALYQKECDELTRNPPGLGWLGELDFVGK